MGLESPSHIAILVVVLLLVFGAKRLPEIGRSLGSGMREFKQSITGGDQQPTITPAAQQPQAPVQATATQPAQAAVQPAPTAEQPPPAVPVEPQHQG